jgi:2-methylisocitrate lyase-like PEP mutase family enzyme
LDEVQAVPKLVNGPCLLNVVWGGKTPLVDLRDAASYGFRLAIVPGLLLKAVIGACDDALALLQQSHNHPKPPAAMTVRDAFNRAGATQWDALRTRFR